MSRVLCIRFDVDTPVCVTSGMEKLLHVAEREDVHFTFFCNMGCSISWSSVLRARFGSRSGPKERKHKLPMHQKLGLSGLLRTIALNPEVGSANAEMLRRAKEHGHEIGLHGGRNHSAWHHGAASWDRARLRDEVEWGVNALGNAGVENVDSFASPGWTSPGSLPTVLGEFGFRFLCDEYHRGTRNPEKNALRNSLTNVPTNIVGTGGVGYLEESAVLDQRSGDSRERFRRDLEEAGDFAMMYDHPCYAGGRGCGRLKEFISVAREMDFQILPVQEAMSRTDHV